MIKVTFKGSARRTKTFEDNVLASEMIGKLFVMQFENKKQVCINIDDIHMIEIEED